MHIESYKSRLRNICDDFYRASGVCIYISIKGLFYVMSKDCPINDYCNAVRSKPDRHKKCFFTDRAAFEKIYKTKKTEVFICHGGLLNIFVPILYKGKVEGFICAYNVRGEASSNAISKDGQGGIFDEGASVLFDKVPLLTEDKQKSIINMMSILAEYLIYSGTVIIDYDADFLRIDRFVTDNIDKRLTVKEVSDGTNISKSSVYRILEKHMGCTLSEFINGKRINKAEYMLVGTDLPCDEIAKMCGFSSTVYFRQVFKRIKGVSAMKYRKNKKERSI